MTIYLLAFDLFMIIYAIHMQSQVANLQYQIDELKKLNEQVPVQQDLPYDPQTTSRS